MVIKFTHSFHSRSINEFPVLCRRKRGVNKQVWVTRKSKKQNFPSLIKEKHTINYGCWTRDYFLNGKHVFDVKHYVRYESHVSQSTKLIFLNTQCTRHLSPTDQMSSIFMFQYPVTRKERFVSIFQALHNSYSSQRQSVPRYTDICKRCV